MNQILLVEDSRDCFNLVRMALGSSYDLIWADSVFSARNYLQHDNYDLVLLDVMLPDGDGFQLGSVLQAEDVSKRTSILFLTAKDSLPDKILGFSIGADDYIVKPFEPLELKARIEAILRKKNLEKTKADIVRVGCLEINKDSQKAYIVEAGLRTELDLTPIEFRVLLFLSKGTDRVFSRDEILNGVWGEDIHVYSRSVDTHISKLRKKLGPKADYIKSAHGTGYRLYSREEKIKPVVPSGPTPLVTGYNRLLSF